MGVHSGLMFQIHRHEPDFPCLLNEIKDPPRLLYYQGDLSCLDGPCLAMVGTRRASPQGLALTRDWARKLSRAGLTIVSGLAYGIDAAAHEGALEADGRTVAVLAHGLADIQPRGNLGLAERILEKGGLILSEHNGEGPLYANDYLVRNRIIAGLCAATLIVEAPFKSGAMNTAKHAVENGRTVFCVPGRLSDEVSQGCLKLLQDGAGLALCVKDLLDDFGLKETNLHPPDALEAMILARLRQARCSAPELALALQNCGAGVHEKIYNMELSGRIRKGLDGRYSPES